jgi:hypothetical protein
LNIPEANTKVTIPTVIANDRYEEAFQVFVKVHAESSDQADMNSVHAEFELIRAQIIHEKHNAVRFLDLFTHKTLRRRTLVGFLTLLGGQAAGTQVVNSKSTPYNVTERYPPTPQTWNQSFDQIWRDRVQITAHLSTRHLAMMAPRLCLYSAAGSQRSPSGILSTPPSLINLEEGRFSVRISRTVKLLHAC